MTAGGPRGYGPAAAFCPRCSVALPRRSPVRCAGCGYAMYVNARPTASVIVLDGAGPDPRFLAVRRVLEPKAGLWEVPGGFCDGWEHPTAAAVREAREELGVVVTLEKFIGMYVGSYEFQDETLPVLDMYWLARIESGVITLDPEESSEMTWFSVKDPPPLAFDTMDIAIEDAARRLSSRP